MKASGMTDFEFIQLWNLKPRSVKEAKTLVPSLETYPDSVIARVIEEMNTMTTAK